MSTTSATRKDSPWSLPNPAQRTQIHEVLRSHSQPPERLPSMIAALSDELLRYDIEIASLQEKLDRLRSGRTDLQTDYDDCRNVFAPIRRLPPEILVDIFGLCWDLPLVPIVGDEIFWELKQLANAPLLILSQVCVWWHGIVMGTAAFWGTVRLAGTLWADPIHSDTTMILLRSALDRGANCSIIVNVDNNSGAPSLGPALQILAQHSARWRTITLWCPFSDLRHLSASNGQLSQLEHLEIYCWGEDEAAVSDIFQVVPRLKRLDFEGSIGALMTMPLQALETFRCVEHLGGDPPLAPTLMPRLRSISELRIAMFLTGDNEGDISFDVPPIVSAISTLIFEIFEEFAPDDARRPLESFIASLTLPCLTSLFLSAIDHPRTSLPWPHSRFLSLSERSSFHAHLTKLYLYEVIITESELLQSLAVLPTLEWLTISDQLAVLPDGTEHLLITDTLLVALTKTPQSPCLIPRLRIFGCQSMLKFDDNIYLKFSLSRLQGEVDQGLFDCALRWLTGYKRALDDAVWARIQDLRIKKEMVFKFLPPKYSEE